MRRSLFGRALDAGRPRRAVEIGEAAQKGRQAPASIVMPAHSRLKNGVAEPVIGPRDFTRARWLAYVAGIHVLRTERAKDVDGRNKSGHDGLRRDRLQC